MNTFKFSAAVFVASALFFSSSVHSATVSEQLSAKEKIQKSDEQWRLPAVPQDLEVFQLVDTQPETRAVARDRAVYRLGYSINQIARAHRVHIDYLPGSDNLTYKESQSIRNLVKDSSEQDRVVITGYSGDGDPNEGDQELARSRAGKIKAVIEQKNRDVMVRVDSTIYWGGDPDDARRAEIFLIPGLNH